jgi:hypothetical protein
MLTGDVVLEILLWTLVLLVLLIWWGAEHEPRKNDHDIRDFPDELP